MRSTIRLDPETIAMFGLDDAQASSANRLLARLGADPPASLAREAFELPEQACSAALWAALRAPYPWPWLAAELDDAMGEASESDGDSKLLCAIIAGPPDPAPPHGVAEALARLGARIPPAMASPAELSCMGHHRRLGLLRSMGSGLDPMLPPALNAPALAAWALPILYTPEAFGPYASMPSKERALLARSCADLLSESLRAQSPSHALLGLGPFRSALAQAPSICAPVRLRCLIDSLSRAVLLPASDIAASVSFHAGADGSEWMRVGLRPAETGFCLSGMDWPAPLGGLEEEFDRLLDSLSACGVVWCHQVEGRFGPLMCPVCSGPVYPNPAHEPWTRMALEAGAPPDGSHLH